MSEDHTSVCPIPGLGHCLGERCNFWDPQKGCVGVGLCFDSEVQKESGAAPADDLFADHIILSAYEDCD